MSTLRELSYKDIDFKATSLYQLLRQINVSSKSNFNNNFIILP